MTQARYTQDPAEVLPESMSIHNPKSGIQYMNGNKVPSSPKFSAKYRDPLEDAAA